MDAFFYRRDIMDRFRISRRVIEGYEKLGLVIPSSHDDRGALLYDGDTVRRIGFIRLCQNMGFELKEIEEFIDGSSEVIKERLRRQSEKIKRKQSDLRCYLKLIEELMACEGDIKECDSILRIFREEEK